MFDIEFIVPYKNLLDIVMEAFEEFPSKEDIKLHVQVMDSTEMKEHTFFGHAIIARGLTAQYIKSLNLNQPLIELPISGYDVIRTITTALASYDAKHIAFIGAPDMIYGAQALELFFKRKITVHPFNIKDDLGSLISHCSKLGADLFIGGNTVFKRASTAGHNAVRVESGKEAVRQALNEGLRAITIWHQERERAERFRVLVDYVHEGILSTDRKGFIKVINNDALKLLKLKNRFAIGEFIGDVVPEIQFSQFQDLIRPSFGELIKINGNSLTMNWIPINVNKQIVGHLITFQKVAYIQEIESRIRKKVHRKGLVAHYNFSDIIGTSEAIQNTIKLAQDYSKVSSNVLIIGETGTGKELFAQSIHTGGNRKNDPLLL